MVTENPYQVLGATVPSMLGRAALVARIERHLLKPSPDHVSVVGPAHYGKSVLLRHLADKHREGSSNYLTTVHIDLRRDTPTSDDAFKRRLAREISTALQPLRQDLCDLLVFEDEGIHELLVLVLDDFGNGTFHRYYYCRNHDPLRAGGEHRRFPGRNIRSDELDAFVFEQARDALLRPDVLLSGEHAVSARREPAADELLQAQLAKLQRKIDAVAGERRRLADLYQAAFIEREELLRRGNELQNREQHLRQRDALIAQRTELAHQNTLRERIAGFSAQVGAAADDLDFEQRQKLLRLVVEHVFVRGWRVEIQLRIPLDEPPTPPDRRMSSKDCLRSLGNC